MGDVCRAALAEKLVLGGYCITFTPFGVDMLSGCRTPLDGHLTVVMVSVLVVNCNLCVLAHKEVLAPC